MANRNAKTGWILCALALCLVCLPAAGQEAESRPAKVYVPYEKLKGVFESEKQGVFLPYREFRRLWAAAQGAPAGVKGVPVPYLISTARFAGKVGPKLASVQLELTVDILAEGWVEVPIALGQVAVAKAAFADADAKGRPLLRVVNGQYRLLTKGKGRHVLKVDFVRQLVSKPGLNVLSFRIPPAAISTLELLIPGENMKVDIKPMLAATTTQVDEKGKKATRLQAFLGAAKSVELSWKPKTQAAAELAPVIIARQLQHIHVAEALVSHSVKFTYDVRRRGVDGFTIQLPGDFRVIAVEGANISKWDIPARPGKTGPQNLQVKLFSPAKGTYELTVKMERFLKEATAEIALTPILTQQALRRTGLIAITHSPRRSVELRAPKNLARVDTGRLPKELRARAGATAWRFITSDYGGKLAIAAVDPRITVSQLWALGVHTDRLELRGRLNYRIERAGVFELTMNLPEPWEVISVGPASIVDDHRLVGKGPGRSLSILLKAERAGSFSLDLAARAPRAKPDAPVNFALPLAGAKYLKLYSGSLVLFLPEKLRAEVEKLDQLQSLPLKAAPRPTRLPGLAPAMAFQFRSVDRAKPAGASFKVTLKPTQVSAVVHRLVNIQPGRVEQEAIVRYQVRYAPVDTFYLKMPAALADAEVQITGDPDASRPRIKEKPRIDSLPGDQLPKAPATTRPAGETKWAYFKVVLQSPVTGRYDVKVTIRQAFQAAEGAKPTTVVVHPILAAGRLADQSGHIAVAKADTLAVLEPAAKNLTPADPSSPADLPYAPHRRLAALAFKYTAPPFELSLPVVVQKEAAVFATMVTAAIVEQVLAPDRMLNTRAIYLLATSRGDRLAITLPPGAVPYQFLLNGKEQAVEPGATPEQRIVRLPPSAGQVSRFVLEISYGVRKAKAGALAAPALPEGVPFQQTLWRIWLPADDYVLGYDRDFSRVTDREAEQTLRAMAAGAPAEVAFGPSREGRLWNFVRQGPPGELSVVLMNKKWFSILIWAVVLAGGAAMLKLCWFRRLLLDLAAAAVILLVYLFAPLLVVRFCLTAIPAAVIVAALWIVHWLFGAAPTYVAARRRAAPPPQTPPPKDQQPPSADEQAEKGQ